MKYAEFKNEVLSYIAESGEELSVLFECEQDDDGRETQFIAKFPGEQITILASPRALKMTVKFGSGHCSMIPVPQEYCVA